MRGPCLLLILCLVAFAGCSQEEDSSGGATTSTDAESDVRDEFMRITIVYANAAEAKRTCASIEDFKEFANVVDGGGKLVNRIESGEIVVRWGLKYPDDYPDGYGNTVVAYERDVPTSGGLVAMDDGKTVEWTAAEFQEKLGGQQPN